MVKKQISEHHSNQNKNILKTFKTTPNKTWNDTSKSGLKMSLNFTVKRCGAHKGIIIIVGYRQGKISCLCIAPIKGDVLIKDRLYAKKTGQSGYGCSRKSPSVISMKECVIPAYAVPTWIEIAFGGSAAISPIDYWRSSCRVFLKSRYLRYPRPSR